MGYNSDNSGFNEPDFPEYDSTPYGGGYDISTTYGKPLPPSDIICYPRSTSIPNQNYSSPPHDFLNGENLIDNNKTKQQNGSTPTFNHSDDRDFNTPIASNLGENSPYYTDDYSPNGYNYGEDGGSIPPFNDTPIASNAVEENSEFGYDYSHPNGYNYGTEDNGYYNYERQVPVPPSDYIEPCASLFGYWPCLLKDYQKNYVQQGYGEQSYVNEWQKTEEYFFGSSYPYSERRDNDVSQVNYGYERHHIEQPSYVQEEYNEQSWSQKLSYSYYESYQES
ncbi:hypothetical protein AQUCO_00900659v1 [Aquilegia coerulea]|uniref:Uncharacterized protein n=1 Tax=Aquilegia coerulea TaxID=218851 RepID=A0A2G5EET9_AQUCA|nr:hypothetical protein AQUCO_00900659v1 [Aquilegia coerulea]PIA54262.1 hypothetical protein AQUCO_00900659v1 [Aquilegia coerulea]